MSAFRTSARATVLSALVLGGGLLLAGPASAHVTLTPGEGNAGEYVVGTIAVPHGCEGSATTKVAIKIPSELLAVTPTVNPLWSVEKKFVKLATPVTNAYGEKVTERVDQVVYTAKVPLEDGYRDAFDLSFQVPDTAGKTLYFPTVQTCEKGQTAWVEIASDGADEPEHPAPAYRVLPALDAKGAAAASDETAPTSVRTSSGEDSRGLAISGLVAGVLGLGLGGAALARTRRRV
ncbi:MAG: YcnI family protein [Marmoricola sp.]